MNELAEPPIPFSSRILHSLQIALTMTVVNGLSSTASKRPFRVIVVGGGVAGLAFSHAFQKVGIGHIVLEKGVVAPPWGASISMWAHGSRILQQLDCLDALEAACLPLKNMITRSKDGRAFAQDTFFDMMVERYDQKAKCWYTWLIADFQ